MEVIQCLPVSSTNLIHFRSLKNLRRSSGIRFCFLAEIHSSNRSRARISPLPQLSIHSFHSQQINPSKSLHQDFDFLHGLVRTMIAAAALLTLNVKSSSASVDQRRLMTPLLTNTYTADTESVDEVKTSKENAVDEDDDEEFRSAFDKFKSKTFALTVSLRIIALGSSLPPSWIKEFIEVQGKRVKFQPELRGSLEAIFRELSLSVKAPSISNKSALAADVVTIGDSWLNLAINQGLIEPLQDATEQDWFKNLDDKWKAFICRNSKGEMNPTGQIWAVPYRWGSMAIAYKKSKFKEHNIAQIEDWNDLWRPELAGKISMVDAPREVVGAVLKYMGSSYNIKDLDSQIEGGKKAVLHNLTLLQRQVRLFDSVNYLKALGAGEVWVAVGWSSDVLPAARRMSNVAVIVPKSGASLWADLWAVPSSTGLSTNQIGGRVRGPSPLIHQWFEFCNQPSRGLLFNQDIIPRALPSVLGGTHEINRNDQDYTARTTQLDTNLVNGVPPEEILENCELLEPLSDEAFKDYEYLVSEMQKAKKDWINRLRAKFSSAFKGAHV